MEEYLGTISVPAIAAAVYFIVKLIRHAVGEENAKFEKFVPLIAAGLGVAFAIVCFYALPAVVPADNVVVAIVIGGASGFTAIGTDQMMKQFGKKDDKAKSSAEDINNAETKKTEILPDKDEKKPTENDVGKADE